MQSVGAVEVAAPALFLRSVQWHMAEYFRSFLASIKSEQKVDIAGFEYKKLRINEKKDDFVRQTYCIFRHLVLYLLGISITIYRMLVEVYQWQKKTARK